MFVLGLLFVLLVLVAAYLATEIHKQGASDCEYGRKQEAKSIFSIRSGDWLRSRKFDVLVTSRSPFRYTTNIGEETFLDAPRDKHGMYTYRHQATPEYTQELYVYSDAVNAGTIWCETAYDVTHCSDRFLTLAFVRMLIVGITVGVCMATFVIGLAQSGVVLVLP